MRTVAVVVVDELVCSCDKVRIQNTVYSRESKLSTTSFALLLSYNSSPWFTFVLKFLPSAFTNRSISQVSLKLDKRDQ
jgi:hypothetical protein